MHKPEISVIMATFNDEKFIIESIESVLTQTFQDFEFIIINDCSTDNTLTIIQSYQERDKRIIVINNPKNMGLTKNLNY
jgi:glycosyltransferase EpsE